MNAPQSPEPRTLDEKVDALRIDVAVIKERVNGVVDHESRIRALERKVWTAAGAATVLGALLSQVLGNIRFGA